MRVGLIGFGRAGKSVASALLDSDNACLEWVVRRSAGNESRRVAEYFESSSSDPSRLIGLDNSEFEKIFEEQPVDVIVDFSCADALDIYADVARKYSVDIVSAISDYPPARIQQLQEIAEHCRVVWSPNITVGINFLMIAAKILQKIAPQADIEIVEEHFAAKPETSGTAKAIAECLGKVDDDIKSVRAGGIVGRHEVIFGFPFQTVRLMHDSISREAFGNGALFAIEHLTSLEKGLYNMQDLMEPYIHEHFLRSKSGLMH
ncbi:4-hydroxy-tetrahydrodipicolinate reductase [Pseudomonas sp. 8AS]|uniref:4-hydroxy-tetrahydrodipicolinate reductase n=1 Tax=Pseudomonas sp. 8AS TaxID=2653163 RepID=UPI0013588D34|nr:dihydrodipicolinate reductase C-terminal domain-containing protein [Pseudomonas sp. 8AS]